MVLSTAAPELVLIGEEDEDLALEAQFARIRNFPLLAELGENNFFRDIQVDRNGYFYPWLGGSSDVTRPSLEEELAKVRDIAFRQLPPELESSYINEMVPQLRAVPADAVELNQVLVKNSIGRSRLIYLFLRLRIQRFESYSKSINNSAGGGSALTPNSPTSRSADQDNPLFNQT